MELTSKQRAFLKSRAGSLQPVMQIGKDGITDHVVASADAALEARELIKITVLETAFMDARDALEELALQLHAQPVAAIGRKIILYRTAQDPKKRKIVLP
ncbi:MAG: ribosome assembly RNA-binding protein YhbY [Clostridia bacterium]|nr:ribosome assembly RNA-binding protein YhbY [Clostridia bacterium]MBQ3928048.1 ribosome assembly RNA-binding protein YhbY [Clostridia bacterium]MBQ7727483.1 ribosome assembly RNA-binding protein YhbY [Clostridia bacterium]